MMNHFLTSTQNSDAEKKRQGDFSFQIPSTSLVEKDRIRMCNS